jgi:HAD superfamily phosphoserine phosphatase-like hydrolase
MTLQSETLREFLLVSDFDQTLSFKDSGQVLSELVGIANFQEKVDRLSHTHLVQQGGELAYLLLHDADFRNVRREHLREAGRKVRLKANIRMLSDTLQRIEGNHFSLYVVSAGPQDIVESALEGIVAPDHIFASQLSFNDQGEVNGVEVLRAGYGKVAILDHLRTKLPVSHHNIVYVGDGSSDIHVMLHVNRLDGLTIAVSENRHLAPIAQRTVLSDDALSILIPIFEGIFHWDTAQIRSFFEEHGFVLQNWEKIQTDTLSIVKSVASDASTQS